MPNERRLQVTVDLDELTSLLLSATDQGLKRHGVYERSGMIGPDIVARVTSSLGASGRIERVTTWNPTPMAEG